MLTTRFCPAHEPSAAGSGTDAGLNPSLMDAPSWLPHLASVARDDGDVGNSPLFRFSSDGKLMADLLSDPE